jgi:hypothetical protein
MRWGSAVFGLQSLPGNMFVPAACNASTEKSYINSATVNKQSRPFIAAGIFATR